MKTSTETLKLALDAMAVGASQVFAFDDLGPLAIKRVSTSHAKAEDYKIKLSADYGGVKIEKVCGSAQANIGRALNRMDDDGEWITLDVSMSMLPAVKAEISKRNAFGDVEFILDVFDGVISVLRQDSYRLCDIVDSRYGLEKLHDNDWVLFNVSRNDEKDFRSRLLRIGVMMRQSFGVYRVTDLTVRVSRLR